MKRGLIRLLFIFNYDQKYKKKERASDDAFFTHLYCIKPWLSSEALGFFVASQKAEL